MQRRLKLIRFDFQRSANGRCQATVLLGREPWERYTGTDEAVGGPDGELRCAAQAALRALNDSTGGAAGFTLLGVKAIRAFDATVVVVAVSVRTAEASHRLVGSYLAEEEFQRGAVLAVLNATNRFLGNDISCR